MNETAEVKEVTVGPTPEPTPLPSSGDFVVVNGQKIPLSVYTSAMNRHQKRKFMAEMKKAPKAKKIKAVRADNPPMIEDSETATAISEIAETLEK